MSKKIYLPIRSYPDEELVAIVAIASEVSGLPAEEILDGFGYFIVAGLIDVYGSLIDPRWDVIDFLEHTEETIHRVVRMQSPGAGPPQLEATRLGDTEVRIDYQSARRMCAVAKGIIRGVGDHYGQPVEVTETTCMHRGDARCALLVSRVDGDQAP
jgi:predicted hydrocarbon binding protein